MRPIRYRGLSKRIHGKCLLEIAELSLQPGHCVALSGRNGAGKSTLMRILAGIEQADELSLNDGGRVLQGRAARRHLRGQVIYVHQHPYLFDRPVVDNIGYGLRCQGVVGEQAAARVEQALKWAGLAQLRDRNAREVSGGERQRLALARAWVLRPRLLLLDEPTANLDSQARRQAFRMVDRLTTEGVGVLLATHEYPAVAHLCEYHLLLEAGEVRLVEGDGGRGTAD